MHRANGNGLIDHSDRSRSESSITRTEVEIQRVGIAAQTDMSGTTLLFCTVRTVWAL